MNKDSVINQLVYYLNYGFISKDLQEDIQEGLMNKKDNDALERLLDSVEYELGKKSNNVYEVKKSQLINKSANTNLKSKIINNNTTSKILNYTDKLNDTITNSDMTNIDDIVFIEEEPMEIINKKKNSTKVM